MPSAVHPHPGSVIRRPDVVDALLVDVLRGTAPDCLVVFGAGGGIGDIVEASGARRVVVAERNVVHARAAIAALAGLDGVEVTVSDGSSHLDGSLRADAVALRAPREKQVAQQLIHDARQLLRPGGRLYLAGAVRDGIKPYIEFAASLFGGMQPLLMRKGCRVVLGTRPEEDGEAPSDPLFDHGCFRRFPAEVRGMRFELHARPGVFAWDRLDEGTRVLAETVEVAATDRVLDLGCGSGLVGLVAARLAPAGHVTMVDSDIVAVQSARRSAVANGIANVDVRLADGASELDPTTFDIVAVNPPFHLDRHNDVRTAERFIEDAQCVLRVGGRLFLVANRFLPYERSIERVFGNCAAVYADRSYKVLRAERGGD